MKKKKHIFFLNQKLFHQTFAVWINGSRVLGAEFDVQGAIDLKSVSAYLGWDSATSTQPSIPLSRVATFRWAFGFCLSHLHSLSLALIDTTVYIYINIIQLWMLKFAFDARCPAERLREWLFWHLAKVLSAGCWVDRMDHEHPRAG